MSDDLPREGSWYINCSNCRADAHVAGHNRTAGDDEPPKFCPFCGDYDVDVIPEHGGGDVAE